MLVLAPMYNVTDIAFRRLIADCGSPDLFLTEFVNVDGLFSPGRVRLEPFLYRENSHSTPVVAQIWGKNPENYYKAAKLIKRLGFDGIDINIGCPDKTVVKNNNCSALIQTKNHPLVAKIIEALVSAKTGLGISVKTRLGFDQFDLNWFEFLFRQPSLKMVTIHGRTVAELSKVPARWDDIKKVRQLRDEINPEIKIVGNGDVIDKDEAEDKLKKYGVDGVMIGRGIFSNPFLFCQPLSYWQGLSTQFKIKLYIKHINLFLESYPSGERNFAPLKKFLKVYLSDFSTASQLRSAVAESTSAKQAREILVNSLKKIE